MSDETNRDTMIAVMANDITYIKDQLKTVDLKVSSNYVTKQDLGRLEDRIKLLERFMYGMVSVALLGIAYALLSVIGLGK